VGIPLRVLMVEDSEDDAVLVLRELRRAGYDPLHERVDTAEGLEAAATRQNWDLILGDYNMPHFSGTAALTLLRERGVDAPFIFVSGTIGEDVAVAAMRAGAQDYVMKGNLRRLAPAIQRELRDGDVRRERRRAQEALLERARLAELNSDVGIALSRGAGVAEILERCSTAVIRHLDAALTRIWIWVDEEGALQLQASAGSTGGRAAERVFVGEGGVGTIAYERHAYVTNSASGDPRVPDQEWVKANRITAFAGYPLVVRGRLVGVLGIFSVHPFSEFALKALAAMADALAVGIEHKHAEEALRRSEGTFRSLVEDSPFGIFRGAPDGRLLAVNPAMVEMLGYAAAAELLRVNLREIQAGPDDPIRLLANLAQTNPVTVEAQWRAKDGHTITVSQTGRVARDADGNIESFTVIVEDITTRRLLESRLRQAQKMEAIGRLAGGVAHDFNNLLTAILGGAELLLEELPADHRAREEGVEIRGAALRAADLTRQLLAFSRQQVLAPRVLNVNDVVAGMEKMLKRLISEDVDFHIALASDIGSVRADPGQLEQVVLNLVVNARDAMPKGGKLTIETGNAELDQGFAREHAIVDAGSYVLLAVTDTGIGMDADTRARIFEPFFTTKPKGEGTGLGLATVYGIVQQSGGYIWVYSEPGQGTSFKIYLPRVGGAPEPAPVATHPPSSTRGDETILLVEDQEEVRRLAQRVLEARGYTVIPAANGEDALRVAQRHAGGIALLLTDVVMPGMSGKDLQYRLEQQRPGVRVLYLSGYTDESVVHHGVLEPGVAFLQKPFTAEVLTRKVREVLDTPPPA